MLNKFSGIVREGNKIGRTLGFPTLNISYDGEFSGVYVAKALVNKLWLPAAVHIGDRPTIDDGEVLAEIHLIDWSGEVLPGATLELEILEKIRDIQDFADLAHLKEQISKDVEYVKNCYNRSDIFDD